MNRTVLISVLTSLSLGLVACSSNTRPQAVKPEIVRAQILTAGRATVPDVIEAVGTVRAAQISQLAAQSIGNIVEIRVHEGDRVQRGQVLAVIDDAQEQAAVSRASAADLAAGQEITSADSDLALADATFKRYQSLFERKSVSPQEFDEVKARYQGALARRDMARAGKDQAHAALQQTNTALAYTRIRSPFDGLITEKRVDAGALASPGMVIFTVEDVHHYRLEATVNENDVQYVRLGQAVPVVIDALGNEELSGKVAQIVPAADPASRSFLIKVELPLDTRLRTGLFGRARLSRGQRPSLLVPQTAVVERGQLQGMYVLDPNQTANLRYLTLGKSFGQNIEVLAGLQEGERFVASPGQLELSGKRVEAQ